MGKPLSMILIASLLFGCGDGGDDTGGGRFGEDGIGEHRVPLLCGSDDVALVQMPGPDDDASAG